jgi:hypothetical protein
VNTRRPADSMILKSRQFLEDLVVGTGSRSSPSSSLFNCSCNWLRSDSDPVSGLQRSEASFGPASHVPELAWGSRIRPSTGMWNCGVKVRTHLANVAGGLPVTPRDLASRLDQALGHWLVRGKSFLLLTPASARTFLTTRRITNRPNCDPSQHTASCAEQSFDSILHPFAISLIQF